MPWDGTELRVGALGRRRRAAGGTRSPAGRAKPRCSPSGRACDELSTRTTRPAGGTSFAQRSPMPATSTCTDADLPRRRRHRRTAVVAGVALVRRRSQTDASSRSARTAPTSVVVIGRDGDRTLDLPAAANVGVEDARGTRVLVTGSGADGAGGVWLVDVDGAAGATIARRNVAVGCRVAAALASGHVRRGRTVRCTPSTSRRRTPTSQRPTDELPPYVVLVHGGPTAHRAGEASAADRVLHEPRDRRARRQLRRIDAATAARTASACADSGASSTSTMSPPPRRGWRRAGAADPRATRDRGRLGRRLDRAVRAHRAPTSSRPASRATASPTCALSPKTPTTSRRTTSTA